jgi:hypothetical protein
LDDAPQQPDGRNAPAIRAGADKLVAFPDCWDGEHLDSDDHVSHTARSAEGTCPETHPVAVPQLLLAITYPVTGAGHDLSLASGSVLTGHASARRRRGR